MLRSLRYLEGYTVSATDAELGKVVNVLFDDEHWAVRYLVVDTGGLLQSRRVLLSPASFREIDWSTRRFHVDLTVDKVRNSPKISCDEPVSRQHEHDYCVYFGYDDYWSYGRDINSVGYPGHGDLQRADVRSRVVEATGGNVHLRSAGDVRGYHIQGTDGLIGHVDDFIVDDQTWHVRYLVVDTSNWWLGKRVLVAPQWARQINWLESRVHVDLTREAIKRSPEWHPETAVNRSYEERLYDYYGRPVYWASRDQPSPAQAASP